MFCIEASSLLRPLISETANLSLVQNPSERSTLPWYSRPTPIDHTRKSDNTIYLSCYSHRTEKTDIAWAVIYSSTSLMYNFCLCKIWMPQRRTNQLGYSKLHDMRNISDLCYSWWGKHTQDPGSQASTTWAHTSLANHTTKCKTKFKSFVHPEISTSLSRQAFPLSHHWSLASSLISLHRYILSLFRQLYLQR